MEDEEFPFDTEYGDEIPFEVQVWLDLEPFRQMERNYRKRHNIPDNVFLGLDWFINTGYVKDEPK